MAWKDVSHNGYTVKSETIKTYSAPRAVYTSEFTIPPKTDFWVICNYAATNLSASTHAEMFIADVAGGTFTARTKTTGYWFNATSAGSLDTATKVIPQDVTTVKEHPRYKIKVPSGGGLVKFVIYYAPGVTW